MSNSLLSNSHPIDFYTEAATLVPHFLAIESELKSALGETLYHLVALRASQINTCGYCIKMHIAEALKDGESQQRLDRLIVWHRVDDFTHREKAALAFVDALTKLEAQSHAALRAGLRTHFSETEIAALTAKVAMINLWNRIQIANY